MATSKSKKVQVLASRIKGKGGGEEVLSDFWDYTCDLTVKTAFLKSKVVQQEEELPSLDHLLTWGSNASPTSRLKLIRNLSILQAKLLELLDE